MDKESDEPTSSTTIPQFGLCSICKDSLGDGEISSTKCGHVYHGSCIKRWLENSLICPVCRARITGGGGDIIRIYPGSEEKVSAEKSSPDSKDLGTEDLLTEEEIEALTSDAFKNQNIVYTQLALLGKKLSEQTTYIETVKAKLEDSDTRYKYEKGEKEALSSHLAETSESLNDLQTATLKMRSENDLLSSKLGEIDATMEYMDNLVEQHKSDYYEAKETIAGLEEEMERIQNACGNVDETLSRIQLLRDEVECETKATRPVEDFVEDILAENMKLKTLVKESERNIETKEYKILDLELNLNGLRETMKEIQISYADQSSESKEMEEALRTMQRLYKDQTDELQSLKSERDQYEKDVRDMLGNLKISEKLTTEVESKRRQSEMLNQTYEGELAQLKAILGRMEKEKQDAMMMVGLKEDVIKSLQESIKSTTDSYFQRLEAMGILNESEEPSTEGINEQNALTLLDSRFKAISEEIEKKDNLLMHLMAEKNTLENEEFVTIDITTAEMKDKIEEMTEKATKLQKEVRERENQVEEKELVIAHLVNVINRYAFNDRSDPGSPPRKKSDSSVITVSKSPTPEKPNKKNSSTNSVMGRLSKVSRQSKASSSR